MAPLRGSVLDGGGLHESQSYCFGGGCNPPCKISNKPFPLPLLMERRAVVLDEGLLEPAGLHSFRSRYLRSFVKGTEKDLSLVPLAPLFCLPAAPKSRGTTP